MKVAPATKDPNRSIIGRGSQAAVKGIAKAMSVTPLIPGRTETTIAKRVPRIGYRILGHEKTNRRPSQAA